MFPADLIHFTRGEFHFPDQMDVSFLRWLDRVRARARVPFIITDDARPPGVMPEGASRTSLHFRGRAVDIRTHDWTAVQKWSVASAIVYLAADAPGYVEFETVYSATDRHWHIGVDDRALHHELIESDE